MKKSNLLIVSILFVIGIVSMYLLNRTPIPVQGEYVLNGDSNCELVLEKYTYCFEGEGDNYEYLINSFGKSGSIKKVREFYEHELLLITNDENGPYFIIYEDGSVEFSLGFAYSDAYDFIKK